MRHNPVFGLDHGPSCGTVPQIWAVMGCAQAGIAILHAHDKIDIDNKY